MPETPIHPAFEAHSLNDHGKQLVHATREIFSEALTKLDALTGGKESRERSLMITELQSAAFWAVRGIAAQPSNQRQP